jgi:hypothetical protein
MAAYLPAFFHAWPSSHFLSLPAPLPALNATTRDAPPILTARKGHLRVAAYW